MSAPQQNMSDPRAYLTPAEREAVHVLAADPETAGRIRKHGKLRMPRILIEGRKGQRMVSWEEHHQLMERVAILEAFCDALVGESRPTRRFGPIKGNRQQATAGQEGA